ncbi:MAG: DUF523 domain-containing protein [Aeriscardovia sp.]|nr:DUF523 domain-containing protein [Aeriscardovia sp.]
MILMSKCLAGFPCRYDGKSKAVPFLKELYERGEAVLVCPEQLGGLPTPRIPAEKRGERVINAAGEDVTEAFEKGAREALAIVKEKGCTLAILKAKSPSCGKGVIHNGLFNGGYVQGDGVFAAMLLEAGVPVLTEEEYLKECERAGSK